MLFFYKRNVDKHAKQLHEERLEEEVRLLEQPAISMSPQELFKLRENLIKDNKHSAYRDGFNFSGIYILHNLTKDKHYVGQSVNVMSRVESHFKGRSSGNQHVYNDFIKGDEWTIKMIRLKDTNYYNLNDLESYAIKLYQGFDKGYNKTRGSES